MAEGEALDLLHGSSSIADQRIYAGDYGRAKDSDIFVITAGLRRKPDESRLDLINRMVIKKGTSAMVIRREILPPMELFTQLKSL